MKINVLTDQSGRILATHHVSSPARPLPASSSRIATKMRPAEGQSLHEVEIPAELCQHILENTLAKVIFKYQVERHGKTAKLVRSP